MANIAEEVAQAALMLLKKGKTGKAATILARELGSAGPAAKLAKAPAKAAKTAPAGPTGFTRAEPGPRQQVEGQLGTDNPDVVFEGTEPANMRPGQWGRMGKHYGVENLGPESTKEWQATLRPFQDAKGNTFTIPHGIESDKPFSYYDMMHLQSQAINPNDLTIAQQRALHNRMVSSHQLAQESADPNVSIFNNLLFGLTSPNNPLTPNLMMMGRGMAKGTKDIETWASWRGGRDLPSKVKKDPITKEVIDPSIMTRFSEGGPVRAMTERLGVQAADRGGLGVGGSHDYTMFPEFAHTYLKDPAWFRFRGELEHGADETEKWASYVERLMNQVEGLSAKTGSLGGVFASPRDAAISAVDRHMLDLVGDGIFATPEEASTWRTAVLAKFNAKRAAKGLNSRAETLDDMIRMDGKSELNDAQFAVVGKHPKKKLRMARTGEFNPDVPEHLRTGWIEEPTHISTISDPFKRAVAHSQRSSVETGQSGLFSGQWFQWDRKRNRIDPHLGVWAGLAKLPRQSMKQMRGVLDTYKKAGYFSTAEKKAAKEGEEVARTIPPVKPVLNASRLGYFTAPILGLGAAGAAGGLNPSERKSRQRG